MIIESGVGNGYQAAVDHTNAFKTRAISEKGEVEATLNGDQYFLTTGAVTLTSATESAVFYYKNNQEYTLLIDRLIFSAAVSTGGTTNLCALSAILNPTGLGSGSSTELTDVNTNLASSNTLITTDSEIGAEAATVTGGVQGPVFYFPDKASTFTDINVAIPKGTSIAFKITPPASNTSLVVSCSINLHKVTGL